MVLKKFLSAFGIGRLWKQEELRPADIGADEGGAQFRQAAESGNPIAQYNLGIAYLVGDGVPVDRRQALEWFHEAAEQGYAEAWYNLGVHYLEGYIGFHRNPEYAYMCFLLAAEAGVEDAAVYLRDIEKMLPKKDIKKAKKLATEWKAKHPRW